MVSRHQKLVAYSVAAVLAIILMNAWIKHSFENDELLAPVRAFVNSNDEIALRFGKLNSVSVAEKTVYGTSGSSGSYTEYLLNVSGSKDHGFILVKTYATNGGIKRTFEWKDSK